eukprot:2731662-Rhodomonas_salina.3
MGFSSSISAISARIASRSRAMTWSHRNPRFGSCNGKPTRVVCSWLTRPKTIDRRPDGRR